MGRNRTPTSILEAKGAFLTGANPARRRDSEPKAVKPLGGPPKYLSDDEKKIWKEISKRLAPGVASASDRDAFELMTRLTRKMRSGEEMKSADRALLLSLWSKFAMTPADRSRVSVEKPPENALARFLDRKIVVVPPEITN